jgi:Tat protein translocase TatB subunit
MFDLSFGELLLVVVVALVFIGPKELPTVVRALAKAMRALRSLAAQVQQLFDELAKESGVKDVKQTLEQDIKLIQGDDGQMYEAYDVETVKIATQQASDKGKATS